MFCDELIHWHEAKKVQTEKIPIFVSQDSWIDLEATMGWAHT